MQNLGEWSLLKAGFNQSLTPARSIGVVEASLEYRDRCQDVTQEIEGN